MFHISPKPEDIYLLKMVIFEEVFDEYGRQVYPNIYVVGDISIYNVENEMKPEKIQLRETIRKNMIEDKDNIETLDTYKEDYRMINPAYIYGVQDRLNVLPTEILELKMTYQGVHFCFIPLDI